MRVCVLVSGGKDSTCNMLKCVQHGHDIVALANLHPRVDAGDELDSFMYQSVGHELVDAYASCMRVPMFRRAIAGSSRLTAMQYAPTDARDEVEDLFELLRDVQRHVDIDAVACGTILSSYQRIRVENVCERLGLLSLAYLWQREQAALLDEMLRDGIDAVMIKTACMGLNRSHIGRPLADLRDRLHALARQYGVHICGEGGEYESFTLDCPFFHQRIVLDECATVVHSDDSFAPVLYLSCKRFHLDDKSPADVRPCSRPASAGSIADGPRAFLRRRDSAAQRFAVPSAVVDSVQSSVRRQSQFTVMAGVHCTAAAATVAEQVGAVFRHCFERLADATVVCVTLYLCSMSDYARVNEIYNELFDADPPARCAVALGARGMPHANALLSVDIVATALPVATLHVQSISEWAPACIGPYSQAKTVDQSLLLLAGQIGLDPATMTLVGAQDGDAAAQFRVADANCAAVVALLADCDAAAARARFQHVVVYHAASVAAAQARALADATLSCPFALVGVDALPRAALIELQVIAYRGAFPDFRVQVSSNGDAPASAVVLSAFECDAGGGIAGATVVDSIGHDGSTRVAVLCIDR
jgi:diphthine-ammonia ligase